MLRSCQTTVILVILIGLALLIFIVSLNAPSYAARIESARSTRVAEEILHRTELTETAFQVQENDRMTREAPTLTSTNTSTVTPSKTSTITPSNTPTVTSTLASCLLKIPNNAIFYKFPSRGYTIELVNVEPQTITLRGRLSDRGWFPVELNSQTMWISASDLEDAESCFSLSVFDLSELQGLERQQRVWIEETFFGLVNPWYNNLGETLYTSSNSFGDYFLRVQNSSEKQQTAFWFYSEDENDYDDFNLLISYGKRSLGPGNYFGVRFHISEDKQDYYELRIFQGCRFEIDEFRNRKLANQLAVYDYREQEKSGNCGDAKAEDFILLNVANGTLSGYVNDFEIPNTPLLSQLSPLETGSISLVSFQTNIYLYLFSLGFPKE